MAPRKNKGSKKTMKPKPTKKASIKALVKAEVHRNIEDKIMNYTFPKTDMLIYTNGSWATGQLFPISPYATFANAVQGTAQNQRIGNELTIKKATIKLLFNVNPYDVATNILVSPLLIKIITFYDRLEPVLLTTNMDGLYQNGSSVSNPDVASNIDILKSYNKDRYVIKSSKTLRLGNAIGVAGAGGSITYNFHSNNDFPLFHTYSLDYTKHLAKQVKYNDTAVSPTTRGLFMAIFVMNADGTALAGSQRPCNFRGFIDIAYEDA